jgi:hypothetical protein
MEGLNQHIAAALARNAPAATPSLAVLKSPSAIVAKWYARLVLRRDPISGSAGSLKPLI